MILKRLATTCLAAVTMLAGTPIARAHYIWVEPSGGAPVLYFGEYDERLHERSPGRLDDIRSPKAWHLGKDGRREVALERRGDRFVTASRARAMIVEENSHPVRDWTKYGIGVVKPVYYARLAGSPARAEPALALDIVPAGAGKLGVYFRGQPLAKAKLEIYAPNGWKQELKTGEDGEVAVRLPWPGLYVAEVTHLEKTPGEFDGEKYEAQRHRATLSLRK